MPPPSDQRFELIFLFSGTENCQFTLIAQLEDSPTQILSMKCMGTILSGHLIHSIDFFCRELRAAVKYYLSLHPDCDCSRDQMIWIVVIRCFGDQNVSLGNTNY